MSWWPEPGSPPRRSTARRRTRSRTPSRPTSRSPGSSCETCASRTAAGISLTAGSRTIELRDFNIDLGRGRVSADVRGSIGAVGRGRPVQDPVLGPARTRTGEADLDQHRCWRPEHHPSTWTPSPRTPRSATPHRVRSEASSPPGCADPVRPAPAPSPLGAGARSSPHSANRCSSRCTSGSPIRSVNSSNVGRVSIAARGDPSAEMVPSTDRIAEVAASSVAIG